MKDENDNVILAKTNSWSFKKVLITATVVIYFLRTDPARELGVLLTTSMRDLILSSWCVLRFWFSKYYYSSPLQQDKSCSIGNQTGIEAENLTPSGWCTNPEQGMLMPDIYKILYLTGHGLLGGLTDIATMNWAVVVYVWSCVSYTIYRIFIMTLSYITAIMIMRYVAAMLASMVRALWSTSSLMKPAQATDSSISNDKGFKLNAETLENPDLNGSSPSAPSPTAFPLKSLLRSFVDQLDSVDAKACTLQSSNKMNLSDYKGGSEAKKELELVVDFLKHPQKFHDVGARLPHGVLLYGPPGTGKTLFARVLAGEAGVQFIHKCASEFRSMFVGSGARNIRQAFDMARSMAPCILFIDEIDSISRRTDSSFHPYANQAINQLLHEMDGFIQHGSNIIVVGATNRLDNIDKALLRPGRFDKTVYVGHPDFKARKEIMEHYVGRLKKVGEMQLDQIATQTDGFSGAELENLINQAAITAVMKGAENVEHEHVETALREGKKSQEKMEDYDSINPKSSNREVIKHMYN